MPKELLMNLKVTKILPGEASTCRSVKPHSTCWRIQPEIIWTPGRESMSLTDMQDSRRVKESKSESSVPDHIMPCSWQTCWSDQPLKNWVKTSLTELIIISSMLDNLMPTRTFPMSRIKLVLPWTSNLESSSSSALNMQEKWRRVSSPLWTTSCPRKATYLSTPVATSELKMTSAFSSAFQVLARQPWVQLVIENWSVMMNTCGLTRESLTLKEDVTPNVSTWVKTNNQRSSRPSDSVQSWKTLLSVQPKRSIISTLHSLRTPEPVILFSLLIMPKYQQLLDTQRTLSSWHVMLSQLSHQSQNLLQNKHFIISTQDILQRLPVLNKASKSQPQLSQLASVKPSSPWAHKSMQTFYSTKSTNTKSTSG